MLRQIILIAGCLLALNVNANCTVQDDTGNVLSLSSPAKKMIVLAPDLVEDVYAVGAGAQIAGVVQGSDFPEAVLNVPVVGSYAGVDLERISAIKPDLIITWKYAFSRQIAALKRLGVPVYIAAPRTLDDVPRLLRNIGCLTGYHERAEKAARQFEMDITALKLSPHPRRALRVFFQIDPYALMTVNRDSWINQVIELCGGKNLFADAKMIAPVVSREAVVVGDPEVIFNASADTDWQGRWRQWKSVTAVRDGRLVPVPPDWISRAGPRLVLGARRVCGALVG
jgi:iron complex transport system substrate-binding protein